MNRTLQRKHILAAVDIGSYSIKLKIAEAGPGGGVQVLEEARKYLNLGRDTFMTGVIRHEQAEELCVILKGFRALMSEYGTDMHDIVATSALREAVNRDYILDRIYQRIGLKVRLISESEEKYYTYGSIADSLKEFPALKKEGVLIADVSSGGVEISFFSEGSLVFSQFVRVGSLRLKEILGELERKTLNFPNLIGEYIESEMDALKLLLKRKTIRNYIVIGSEILVLHEILEKRSRAYDRSRISKEDFYALFNQTVRSTRQQISDKYGLSPDKVETLVPALLMYEKFLGYTQADKIFTPPVTLCDGLLRTMADMEYGLDNSSISEKDIVSSVRRLGERYLYDREHAEFVERVAMQLFDGAKRLHGFSGRERLLLQIAAIAHDFGKFINARSHSMLSYDIMMNSDILGLSKNDLTIVANIIRFHSRNSGLADDPGYNALDFDTRLRVSKLTACLKLADAMDRSHRQKLSEVRISLAEQSMTVRAETGQDALLEEWEFEKNGSLFEEVFGIRPVLAIKRKERDQG
jgi:exopolyphosphatase/guanosine-5'-triphosphate,3'-diphosphate pyrophosphatase